MNRRGSIVNRLTGNTRESPVLEGRINLVSGKIVLERNDDSSLFVEFWPAVACHIQHRPAESRIPKPELPFPAIAGQQCSCGVEGRTQANAGRAFEGRPADTAGSVPEIDLSILARGGKCCTIGAPGDTLSQGRQRNRTDELSRVRINDLAGWLISRSKSPRSGFRPTDRRDRVPALARA